MTQMRKLQWGLVLSVAAVLAATTEARAQETGSIDTSARGVVQALTEATVAVDYTARIRKLPFKEGQAFRTGDVLIVFDCRKYHAEVQAAKAQTRAHELKVTTNRKLLEKGAIGASEVRISEAELEKARADVMALQARTGSCDFKAPFNGRLVERIAAEHEIPGANQPLIRIVDTSRFEVEAIIPSKWMSWVKTGTTFTFLVDETGETLGAKVVRMGATVDPVSQTIKAYGVLTNSGSTVLPGMSGTATFRLSGS
jgi:RND family efflux transporter MFP subunit